MSYPPKTAFISGHLDLSEEEFLQHYAPAILDAAKRGCVFVVGDARGADLIFQRFAHRHGLSVTVFHMFASPRNNAGGAALRGGFASDEARDQAMTLASTEDIAWVRPGREKSGTAKNLTRRKLPPKPADR